MSKNITILAISAIVLCIAGYHGVKAQYLYDGSDKIQIPDIYTSAPNPQNCVEGALKESEKQKILDYINSIRKMHDLKPVIYDYAGDEAASKGAMVCAANSDIQHDFPQSWECASDKALYGTLNSNLYISWSGQASFPQSENSIVAWMIDIFASNVGHRRAIMNPFVDKISFGRADGSPKVSSSYPYVTTMALKYMDNLNQTVSDMNIDFVAYPYHDYSPKLVDKSYLLSFSAIYNKSQWWDNSNVDYTNAVIEVKGPNNQVMNVHNKIYDNQGWGGLGNSVMWKVDGLAEGVRYDVVIRNVKVNGVDNSYSYWFNLREPQQAAPGKIALNSPANGGTASYKDITFYWVKDNAALNYNLQLSKTSDFKVKIIDKSDISETIYKYSNLEKETKYYWRVKGINNIGEGNWSDTWSFTTEGAGPGALPELAYPAEGEANTGREPKVGWTKVSGASSYYLQITDNKDFLTSRLFVNNQNVLDTFYQVPSTKKLPADSKMYWRVKVMMPSEGVWSDVGTFYTGNPSSVYEYLDKQDNNLINIIPNPVRDRAKVVINLISGDDIEIYLTDISGRKVLGIASGTASEGTSEYELNLGGISSGTYFLTARVGGAHYVKILEVAK